VDDPAYDSDVGPLEVGVYAEIERLCEGETVLPGGAYDCRFFLTEESFHQSGEYEGNWLSVLVCDTLFFELLGSAGIRPTGGKPDLETLRVLPNPSRSSANIVFSLIRAAPVDAAVYNAAGRLIARVAEGDFTAGTHSLAWDGLDSSGRSTPAGVYFCRVRAGRESRTRKVVVTD
jgi:hypothetical protein